MSQAMSETVGYVNRARSFMPPGTVPPFITRFDAGSVAVGLLVFSSAAHTQGEMQDFAHQSRASFVRDPARRFRAAALRRESAHHRGDARSGQAAAVSDLSRGGHRRGQQVQRGDAIRQHVDRQDRAHRAHQLRAGREPCGPARHADPARVRRHASTCAISEPSRTAPTSSPPTRTSTASGPSTFPVTKRADASTLAVINAVKAAIPDIQESRAGGCRCQPAIRSVALRHQFAARPGDRRPAGRGAHRPDGADLPARLAQRR